MQVKVGDRYKDNVSSLTFEVTDKMKNCIFRSVCLIGSEFWKVGDIAYFHFAQDAWKYLGNFSKSDNFNNLYRILCS